MSIALALIGGMLWCFIWGIIYVSQNLDDVFASRSGVIQTVSFNLSGARSLNLKGLIQH